MSGGKRRVNSTPGPSLTRNIAAAHPTPNLYRAEVQLTEKSFRRYVPEPGTSPSGSIPVHDSAPKMVVVTPGRTR